MPMRCEDHEGTMRRDSRKLLVSAAVAVLIAPATSRATEPVGDEDLLEFLGGVDQIEDEDFQEYLLAVDLKKVAATRKPKANSTAAPAAKSTAKSDPPKSEEP